MNVKLTLQEVPLQQVKPHAKGEGNCTLVHVDMKPIRNRDRRRSDLEFAVARVIASLRCYLMGDVISRDQTIDAG